MKIIALLFYLTLIILGVGFATLNASQVTINFYFDTLSIPISVLVACSLAIGILLGFILFIGKYWRLKIEHHRIKQQLKTCEKELQNLRTMPMQLHN